MRSPWQALGILLGTWTVIIILVNPVGEFMVNDDWAFVKSLEALRHDGRLIATGWGFSRAPGGPFLLVHLFWGHFFTSIWGYSLTTLRLSVLLLGVLGSCGILLILRAGGAALGMALLGALTVALNPLYLTQCFTFMTDITFAALAVGALFFLVQGFARTSWLFTGMGLLLVLASICTRQIGIVILPALFAAWWLHRGEKPREVLTILLLGFGLVIIPWVLGELFLQASGSTPLFQNQAVQQIFRLPREKGLWDYLCHLGTTLFGILLYTGFFVSPLLIVHLGELWPRRGWKIFFGVSLGAVLVTAGALLAQAVHLPVFFPGNVIFDFGLGPILLKDTYILGLPRTTTLSPPQYLLLVSWATLAAVLLLHTIVSYIRRLVQGRTFSGPPPGNLGATLALLAALAYLVIILLMGFRDRYLIPLIIFLCIFLVLAPHPGRTPPPSRGLTVAALSLLLFLGAASALSLHDFMQMKQALTRAQVYLVGDLQVNPCQIDGGFEFNGYHCYRPDFEPRPGLSWWWVAREDYLLTLGPLPDYAILRIFPFPRYLGPDGAVFLLRPQTP